MILDKNFGDRVRDEIVRRAAAVDDNQKRIVMALRKVGATVEHLHAIGHGAPDILCGYRGVNYLLELKDGRKPPSARRLTPDQVRWIENWRGAGVRVVTSVDESLAAIGALA